MFFKSKFLNKKGKIKPEDFVKLKGKSRIEIIELLGKKFHPESNEDDILVYIVDKTCLNRKGMALYIEFNKEGKADTIYKQYNYEF